MTYSPFDNAIGQLTAEDLQQLLTRKVAEGYWVEYKSEFPTSTKMGHSIASFVNTYGGWYFIGVQADKIANEPMAIPGFSLTDHPDPIATIRNVVRDHISPTPLFYEQVITLDSGNVVLVVFIPEGQATPFISLDGRIYQRVNDASEPISKLDRHTLDRLYDRGRDVAKRFKTFSQDERTFSQGESEQIWVKIFLSPYPLGIIPKLEGLEDSIWEGSEGIERLLELSRHPFTIPLSENQSFQANLPFNVGQPTLHSYILRQVNPGKAPYSSLTAEIYRDGRAKFFIPLEPISFIDLNKRSLESAQVRQVLKKIIAEDTDRRDAQRLLRFYDVGFIWLGIASLLGYYHACVGVQTRPITYQTAIQIAGIWRAVPFFDIEEWAAHVQNFGLPVSNHETIRVPHPTTRDYLLLPFTDTPLWLELCSMVGLGVGLPMDFSLSNVVQAIIQGAQRTAQQSAAS